MIDMILAAVTEIDPVPTSNWLNTSILGGILTVLSAGMVGLGKIIRWIWAEYKSHSDAIVAKFEKLTREVTDVLLQNSLTNAGLKNVFDHVRDNQRALQIQVEHMASGEEVSATEASVQAVRERRELESEISKINRK